MLMTKRKPVTVGEILLEEFMKPLGLSINRLSRDLVVPPGIDVMSEADLTVATVLIPRGLRDEAAAAQDAAAAAPAAPAKAEKSE